LPLYTVLDEVAESGRPFRSWQGQANLRQRLTLITQTLPPIPAEGLPPCHSITSSARARNEGGTSRPSAAAVFKLTTSLKPVLRKSS
jgi:hypothetical protein